MNQKEEKWEKELLETTEKSWGFIATQSKQDLMLADFERRKAFIKERFVYKPDLIALVEGKKTKHIIDIELYHDSGGGEMCEVCGKQGTELDEPCDRNNDWNAALDGILKALKDTLSNKENL